MDETEQKRKEAVKKAKAKGAVECKGCGRIIADTECLIDPKSGKYYHLDCAPRFPKFLAKGKIFAFQRVVTPGKHKKQRDTRHWVSCHSPFDMDDWDE